MVAYAPNAPAGTEGLFLAATWNMSASNGTSWDARDTRFTGTDDFAAGLDVVYAPRTDGTRAPVDETLTLRVGLELWQTVPAPTQRPSEYAQELAREVSWMCGEGGLTRPSISCGT